MKSTVLTGILFLATGACANAQLSFLPQVGFEQSRSTVNYNNLSTAGMDGNLRTGLKIDYRVKGGHGPYINLGTSPAPMNFVFNDAGSLMKSYQSAKNNLQFRLEAGYQYTSRPIQFKKNRSVPNSETADANSESPKKKSCGSVTYKSHCGDKKKNHKAMLVNNSLNMRLQPSLGVAYIPATGESIKPTASGFEYNAANWNTAIVPAMGFEFAKGRQRLFTLTVFYTKPVGMNEESFTGFSGSKATVTHLTPEASTWGMTVGVPFSFTKSNVVKTKKVKKESNRTYYRRCIKN